MTTARRDFTRTELVRETLTLSAVLLAALLVAMHALDHVLGTLLGAKVTAAWWTGFDAQNYWDAWRLGLYHGTPKLYGGGDFLYSPAFAQLLWPLTQLPFWAFRLAMATPAVAAYAWLLRPAPWRVRIPLGIVAAFAVTVGNLEWALGLLVVFVDRAPAGWALPVLTKLTPGVGALYYLGERNIRRFAIAIAATCGIAAVSFAAAPDLWWRWIDVLHTNANASPYGVLIWVGQTPLIVRLAVAGLLALWSGRRSSRLGLLAAIFLAQPDPNYSTVALFVAAPRCLRKPQPSGEGVNRGGPES